jgi:hypothetical protein
MDHLLKEHEFNLGLNTGTFGRVKLTIFVIMITKFWQIIRDDSRKTFEVCGQEMNTNYFCNLVHGMQRARMNVSQMTPPVTNKTSSKDLVKIIGYQKEEGLYQRLEKEYAAITRQEFENLEDD